MMQSVPERLTQAANLVDSGDYQAGETICRQLLEADGTNPHALHILGVAARKQQRFEQAAELLARSLAIAPRSAGVNFERGVALIELKRLEEALEHFRHAAELNPDFQEACINACTILERLDRMEEALPWARRAVELKPDCATAHFNLGNVYQALGRVDEAIRCFEAAFRLQPDFDNARWNASLAQLLVGRFTDGWQLYESRSAAGKVTLDRYPQPRWQGEALKGKTILVHAEQGIGDEILFASCFPNLMALGGKLIVVCEPRLEKLFARSFPTAKVYGIARRKNEAPADVPERIDFQIPAGSLPGFFRRSRESFPHRWRFLMPDHSQQRAWRARLDDLGAGLKIGISWKAGGQPTERRKRTTALDEWLPIFSVPGTHFVNLQYGDTAEELASAQEQLGVTIHDFAESDPLVDMDAFAAKVSALDLVISVGNATVHLAGALGVPAWTILPLVPAWRWMLKGDQSLWYPSVRLFRQLERRVWVPVFEEVASALAGRTGRAGTATSTYNGEKKQPPRSRVPAAAGSSTSPFCTLAEVTDTFQTAVDAYNRGELLQAESICQQILAHAPRDAKALDLRGLIARATGRTELAIKSLELAVQVYSGDPQMHLHLAGAYQQAGRLHDSVASYRRAIELAPDVWAMHFELGGLLRAVGMREEAIESYYRAIHLDPTNAKAHNALAGVQMELLRWADAEASLRWAIEHKPDYMAAFNNLGQCLQFQGRAAEAIPLFGKAISLDPHCHQAVANLKNARAILAQAEPEVRVEKPTVRLDEKMSLAAKYYNDENMPEATRLAEEIVAADRNNVVALRILGVAARQAKEMDRSLELLQRAVHAKPDDHALRFELGVTLTEMHRTREALPQYLRAVELRPSFHPPYVNISAIHEQQEHYEEVIEWTRKALAIKPDCALSRYNLSNALRELGRVEEAIVECRRSIELNPAYVKAVWNLGLSHLLVGDYTNGWPLFEKRIELGEVAVDDYTQPRWDGSPMPDKTLLVHGEQGIGDEVLFASCFPEVFPRVGKCVIICEPRLEMLFRRSFPQATVYGYTRRKDGAGRKLAEPIDAQIPAGSLPMLLRRTPQEFPDRRSFLVPDEKLVTFWRDRLTTLGPGLKIGISWRAGGKPQERRKRMIPLELWRDVLTTPNVHFVNLQYSDSSQEVAEIGRELGITIHDWEEGDPLVDMDSFAAKIKSLDLVISVGNATVHMAGAVGTPTWTLLPMVPSWRWMVRGEQSPWYPSVQLFRQPQRGDWSSVLARVAERLRKQVGAPLPVKQFPVAKPQAEEAGDDGWYEAKEIITDVMIDSINVTLTEADKCAAADQFDRAEELYREVLQIAPRHYQALHGLGLVARRTGRHELAIRSFQRSLAMIEAVPVHHFNYAGALAETGRFEEAAREYLRTLELDPSMSIARLELGRVLQRLGEHEQALAQFGKAALPGSEDVDLLVYRGISLAAQCRIDEAVECFEQALRMKPAHLHALGALADAYLEDQQYDDAERCLRRAIAIRSDVAAWHAQLGRVLRRAGHADEAVEHLEQAVELSPGDVAFLSDLGSLCREVAQPDRAADCFRKALALKPDSAELLNSLGLSLADQGQTDAAILRYEEALAVKSNYATAHVNRAFALLAQGRLTEGWRAYEWRWQVPRASRPHLPGVPMWHGESLADRSLLVFGEQGVGDEIMFASGYRDLIRQARQVTIVCQPRLEQLFGRSFPEAEIVAVPRGREATWRSPAGWTFDAQIAAGSLPGNLSPACESSGEKYLRADLAKVSHWLARYLALGDGLKVGISWRAGESLLDRRVRGDSLEPWRALLTTPGIHFVNLQYGDVREELREFARESGIVVHQWMDADNTTDLDGLAARIAALDLVISVGNTTVHLAGSLGVPTWTLLPNVPGWRWTLGGERCPWYDSVRLFRQIRRGDWGEPFRRVRHELLNRPVPPAEEAKRGVIVAPHLNLSQTPSKAYR